MFSTGSKHPQAQQTPDGIGFWIPIRPPAPPGNCEWLYLAIFSLEKWLGFFSTLKFPFLWHRKQSFSHSSTLTGWLSRRHSLISATVSCVCTRAPLPFPNPMARAFGNTICSGRGTQDMQLLSPPPSFLSYLFASQKTNAIWNWCSRVQRPKWQATDVFELADMSLTHTWFAEDVNELAMEAIWKIGISRLLKIRISVKSDFSFPLGNKWPRTRQRPLLPASHSPPFSCACWAPAAPRLAAPARQMGARSQHKGTGSQGRPRLFSWHPGAFLISLPEVTAKPNSWFAAHTESIWTNLSS